MKKLVSVMMICSLLLVGCGGSKDDTSKEDAKKEVTVLTSGGYPPYEMVDENGDLYGFDIDVLNAAASIAGYEVKWKDMDFDGIVESIKQNKGDIAIAGLTPTPDRAEQVDFSEPYYTSEEMKNVVLVKNDSGMKTTDDIKGKTIGVQIGTVQDSIMDGLADEYDLSFKKLKSFADLAQELNKGVIDAIVVEKATATELAAKNENFEYYMLEAGADLAGNAMAFKKGSKLKADFDKAITELKDNGELEKLVEKWFK